jgi:hypothetical protein
MVPASLLLAPHISADCVRTQSAEICGASLLLITWNATLRMHLQEYIIFHNQEYFFPKGIKCSTDLIEQITLGR